MAGRRVLRTAAVWLVIAGSATTLAAGGGLDSSFAGGSGWLRTVEVRSPSNNYLPGGAEDLALQADGKLLVVGKIIDGLSHWYFGVFRYTAEGALDGSFGAGGWAELDLGGASFAHTVAVQRDGRIVVAGEGNCDLSTCFTLVRFMPDGSVDRSFSGGVVRTRFATYGSSRAYDVAVQPDGKIVVVGMRYTGSDAADDEVFAVARYLPDGSLDRTFSGDGLASVDFGYGDADADVVAVQPNGRILVAGNGKRSGSWTAGDFAVARLLPDGRLDRSFSGDGRSTVDFGRSETVYGLALQRDGRIVAAGSSGALRAPPRIGVMRLRADGRLDHSFGSHGKLLTRPGSNGGYARAVVQQRDGRILVGGRVFDDDRHDTSNWVLVRYRPTGGLDTSFGRGGLAVGDYSTGADWVGALATQPDGRIVAAGEIGASLGLARYRPS
jgi:uncharacterized delta-60 repeat protein